MALLCLLVPVGSLVDPDESGALLVALWSHAFDQLELLPIEEGPVPLSPLGDTASPPRVQACDVPTRREQKGTGGSVRSERGNTKAAHAGQVGGGFFLRAIKRGDLERRDSPHALKRSAVSTLHIIAQSSTRLRGEFVGIRSATRRLRGRVNR